MSILLLVDLVIGFLVIEAIALGIRRPRRLRIVDLLPNLAAGFFLLLALRAGIQGDGFITIAALLAGAGVAHALDLLARTRR